MAATGPATRVVCRILNQSSCGSGSICGIQPDGKALIMTNAHVAGTRVGRVVTVEVESQGSEQIQAKIVASAYSDRTSADWALLETLEPYTKVKPVKLSKSPPSGSHYTKGFPRCRPHSGTDIRTVEVRGGVWFWEPDAIGGQSGSGVWCDEVERQEGLLTWQWGQHGAGQPTSAIYGQMRHQTVAGSPRPDGLTELENDYDLSDVDTDGLDDPIVETGFMAEMGIQDFPIWWEADAPADPGTPDQPVGGWLESQIDSQRRRSEFEQAELERLESQLVLDTNPVDPDKIPPGGGGMFGLTIAFVICLLASDSFASSPYFGLDPVQQGSAVRPTQLLQPGCSGGACRLVPKPAGPATEVAPRVVYEPLVVETQDSDRSAEEIFEAPVQQVSDTCVVVVPEPVSVVEQIAPIEYVVPVVHQQVPWPSVASRYRCSPLVHRSNRLRGIKRVVRYLRQRFVRHRFANRINQRRSHRTCRARR